MSDDIERCLRELQSLRDGLATLERRAARACDEARQIQIATSSLPQPPQLLDASRAAIKGMIATHAIKAIEHEPAGQSTRAQGSRQFVSELREILTTMRDDAPGYQRPKMLRRSRQMAPDSR